MTLIGKKLPSYDEIQEARKQLFKVGDKVELVQYPSTNYACSINAVVTEVLHPHYMLDIDHHDETSILRQRNVKAPIHFLRPRKEADKLHPGTDNTAAARADKPIVCDSPIFKGRDNPFEPSPKS